MLEGIFSRNSFIWIVNKHLLQQVQSFGTQARNILAKIFFFIDREICFIAAEILNARPFVWSWSASNFKYLQQLILFIFPLKQCLFCNNFSKNTSNRPNVDRSAVVFRTHEDIRGTIPQSDYFMCEVFHWNTKSPG